MPTATGRTSAGLSTTANCTLVFRHGKSEEATIKVGAQLVDALRALDFAPPEWNGSTKARVLCHDVTLEFPLADDLTD
ncbi:hypothetical protein [Corynebacterium hesseae]